MKIESTNHKVGRLVDDDTGRITLFLADENWGPVISGATEEEVESKFTEALKACGIIKSIFNIQAEFDNDSLGRNRARSIVEKNNSAMAEIQKSIKCA